MEESKVAAVDSRAVGESVVNRVFVTVGVYLIAGVLLVLGLVL